MACIGKRGWSKRKRGKRKRVEERWREVDVEREVGERRGKGKER